MLPAGMTLLDVVAGKLEEYLVMQTGDHRPNVKSRHFAPPKKKKLKKQQQQREEADVTKKDASDIKMARGQYFADGPPVLTLRQEELYGLVPYNRHDGEDLRIHSSVRLE